MIEKVHDHIIEELKINTRTDTIFILTSIALNLLTLAINSIVAAVETSAQAIIIFVMFTTLVFIINSVSVIGLLKGMDTRQMMLKGLIKMYEDKNVAKYYDPSILSNYKTRYILFIIVVAFTGITAITIPIILLTI